MKATVREITEVYGLLNNGKYTKMDNSARKALTRAMRPMKRIAEEFGDFRKDAVKTLRPEGFEEVEELIHKYNALPEKERTEAVSNQEYQKAFRVNTEYAISIEDCIREEAEREVELEIAPLAEEALDSLLDSNPDWTLGMAMAVEDILCSKAG